MIAACAGPGARRTLQVNFVLAISGGIFHALALPGMLGWWPLAIVCFVPLILVFERTAPAKAAFYGLIAGVIVMGTATSWISASVARLTGATVITCGALTGVVCVYQAGRYALMGYLYARSRRNMWPLWCSAVSAFVVSEILYPMPFPFFLANYAGHAPVLLQSADIGGPIFCGMFIFGGSVGIVGLVRAIRAQMLNAELIVGVSLILGSAIYGAIRIRQIRRSAALAPPLHVGFVQANLGPLENYQHPEESIAREAQLTEQLRSRNVRLIIWSESAVARDALASDYARVLPNIVAAHSSNAAFVVGSNIIQPGRLPGHYERYNSAISISSDGSIAGRYDKQILFPLGEYDPLDSYIHSNTPLFPKSGRFTPGPEKRPLRIVTDGVSHRAAALVCYEDAFTGYTRHLVDSNVALIVNISNEVWFGNSLELFEHLSDAQLRAVEHHRYLVRSANSGISAIIDPTGMVVVQSPISRAYVGDSWVRWMSPTTVYETLGDIPIWSIAIAGIATAFLSRRRRLATL